ncbi:hypothetical protein TNCV_2567991 [Trichonephila clavipes]|uniref:Uncharacterized protein n=1 Tax=Trichonephila clavipes TaxID=2585209 RepID=A0A8X6WLU0_TRICX|nr:hypothetical protein TNCV_2567991 [Trichonephila clavipes]
MPKKKCALRKVATKWPILEESVANRVLENRLNGLIVTRNSVRLFALKWSKKNAFACYPTMKVHKLQKLMNSDESSQKNPSIFEVRTILQRPCLVSSPFDAEPPNTDSRRRQSAIHRVQCIGAGGHHPFRHGRRAGRPRQQPDQASGGIHPKCHVRWLCESRQQPSGAFGLDPQGSKLPMAFQSSWCVLVYGSLFVSVCGNNALCSSEGQEDSG